MDNFHIDITCEGEQNLERAMLICFSQHREATHYAVRGPDSAITEAQHDHQKRPTKPRRLVFMWTGGARDTIALPFKLDALGATDFAKRWLAEQEFGKQPDHDGDNEHAWRLYCEGWGHVDGEYQAIVAVTPAWAMYGK